MCGVLEGDEPRHLLCPVEQADEAQLNGKKKTVIRQSQLMPFVFPFEVHFVPVGKVRTYLIKSYMKRWKMKKFREMRMTENETLGWSLLCRIG